MAVSLGRVLTLLLALLIHALVARLLTPSEFGVFFLLLTLVSVASVFGQFGLPKTVVLLLGETVSGDQAGQARATVISILRLSFFTALLVGLAVSMVPSTALARWTGRQDFSVPMVFVGIWTFGLVLECLAGEVFRGLRHFGHAMGFRGLLSKILTLMLMVGLFVAQRTGFADVELKHVVLCFAVCVFMVCLAAVLVIVRKFKNLSKNRAVSWRAIVCHSWPMFVTALVALLLEEAGILILSFCSGSASDMALFGLAVRLARLVGMPLIIVNGVVLPIIAELHAGGDRVRLEAVLRFSATTCGMISLIATGIVSIGGPAILGLLFGSFYRQASGVLLLLAVGKLANAWTGSCGIALLMTRRQRTHLWINLVTLLLVTAGGVFLTRWFGVLGMAVAVLGSGLVQQALFLVLAKRALGFWTMGTWNTQSLRNYWRLLNESG